MRSLLLAASIAASCMPAAAQTAEETAAYLLFGLDDEAYTTIAVLGMAKQFKVWKDLEEENIWYGQVVDGAEYSAYVINQEDDCIFSVRLMDLRTRDDSPVRNPSDLTIDMTDLKSATFTNTFGVPYIEFNSVRCSGAGNCAAVNGRVFTAANEARWNRALAYFNENFCSTSRGF